MSEPTPDQPKEAAPAPDAKEGSKDPKTAKDPKAKEAAAAKPAAAKGSPPFLLIGVMVGALAAGGALGALVVAPQLVASRKAPAAAAPHAEAEADAEAESEAEPAAAGGHGAQGGGHGKSEGKRRYAVRLENLIVNPAGSGGTRFLMATVVFEVPDEKVEARLRDHEVQVRDQVMSTLEGHTLEMLTAPGARDSLKARLARAVASVAGRGQRVRVYLPQFVLQ